jgi:hypothetical protein
MSYALTTSPRCRQAFWAEEWFRTRAYELRLPHTLHRKWFELICVAQVYGERIGFGGMACGFGVGVEPLPAWLVGQGCEVRVTNLDETAPEAQVWQATDQYVRSVARLPSAGITSAVLLEAHCHWQAVDMRALPPDLGAFDLLWSTCALEHLGERMLGLDFIVNAARLLTPGGWAVHTTELQLSQDQPPLDHAGTVLYVPDDLGPLGERLAAEGVTLLPLDLEPGTEQWDTYVDGPPYEGHLHGKAHLQLAFAGRTTTSVALIMHRES